MDLKRALAGWMGSAQNLFVPPAEAAPALRDEQRRRRAVHQNDNKNHATPAATEEREENPAVIVMLGKEPAPRVTYEHLRPRR